MSDTNLRYQSKSELDLSDLLLQYNAYYLTLFQAFR